jgi:Ca2+-binding RTX toxin-like protein
VLHGGTGQNVLDGGAGDDVLFDGAGDAFIAGGAGNDTIKVGTGRDVVAFNRGDGTDTIIGGGDGGNTLSLGGGIKYSDLTLSKSGDDLVVGTGGDDRLVFRDWYGGSQSVLTLQLMLDATDEFDAGSTDPLRNKRVESFSFLGLVSAFDQARVQSPGLTSWELTNALLQYHLSGADDMALGGDLAYWYARRGSLAGLGLQAAQQAIGAPGFGAEAQQLHAFEGLQEGLVKLA